MRVVMTPLNWPTHYRHQVPLAWALRAAGHEVVVACGSVIAGAVRDTGMIHAPVGDAYDFIAGFEAVDTRIREVFGRVLNSEALQGMTPEEMRLFGDIVYEPFARYADEMTEELADLVRDWRADLIITDAWVYAGPLASQVTGVPLVRNLIGPDLQRSSFAPGLSGAQEGEPRDRWPEPLLKVFGRFGVEPRDEYADLLVDPCPDDLQLLYDSPRQRMRYVPFNGAGTLVQRAAPQRPRVCVTWGTMTGGLASQERFLLPEVLKSVAALAERGEAEVVAAITRADADRLGDATAGIQVLGETPLHLLLPTCDAIVHQGGSGTLLTAAAAGVPQVVIPEVGDQTLNAAQLTASGAGLTVAPDRAGDTAAAVAALLTDPAHRVAAGRLREHNLDRPAPAEVVPVLEKLARRARR